MLTYADREGYVGDFERGMRHGSGTMHFRNGGKFEGDFKEVLLRTVDVLLLFNLTAPALDSIS